MPPRRTMSIPIPPLIDQMDRSVMDWVVNSATTTRPDWYDTVYQLRECDAALGERIEHVRGYLDIIVANPHWAERYPAQLEAYLNHKREVKERLTARKREIEHSMATADLATGSLLGFDPNEELPYETFTFEEFVRYWQDPLQQLDPPTPARRRNPIPHWSDRVLQVEREVDALEPEPVVINGQKSHTRLRGSRTHVSLQFQTTRGSYPRSAVTLVITGHGMVLQRTAQHYLDCCHGLQLAHRADDPRELQVIAEEKHDGE